MENVCEVKHYDKIFGNCKVSWKIEDFCLATCEEDCIIESSEFCVSGPEPTMWKLILLPKPLNTCNMRMYLKRLYDSGPKNVLVDWSLTIGSLKESYYYSEYNHNFEKMTKKRTDVCNITDVLSRFRPYDCDTLFIQCHLLVQHRNRFAKLVEPKTLGLKCLSEDFRRMLQCSKDKDFTIQVEKNEILVHKAVLTRNASLRKLIQNANDNIVTLPNLNSAAVTKYADFLYTGDSDKILKNPSVSMYNCIQAMDRDLLHYYFAPEELVLHTKLKVEEFEHLWIVRNFSTRNEEILSSPHFKNASLNTTWKLRIYFSGIDNIDYISIYADVVEGVRPSNVCLEFAVIDSKEEFYHPRKILSSNGNYDSGFKEYIKKDLLNETSLVVDDTLNLTFKVRTWNDGEYSSTTGCRMMSFITETEESSYVWLSKSLLNLYWSGINSDIRIQAASAFFEAHKCVLSARSPVLSVMIDELDGQTVLTLDDVAPCVLNLLLEYVYSGVLPKLDNMTLITLCKAAEAYGISSLEEECQQALRISTEEKF